MNCLERVLNQKIGLEEETDGWKGQRNNKNERWSVVTLPPPRRVHPSFKPCFGAKKSTYASKKGKKVCC